MQDNGNQGKDEPVQQAVSRAHHQEPDNGLDEVALVQFPRPGTNKLKTAARNDFICLKNRIDPDGLFCTPLTH